MLLFCRADFCRNKQQPRTHVQADIIVSLDCLIQKVAFSHTPLTTIYEMRLHLFETQTVAVYHKQKDMRSVCPLFIQRRQMRLTAMLTVGLAAGMFLSLIWMVLLRFCAGIMAWAAIIVVNVLCAACTILAFLKVPDKLHNSHREVL